jgi:AAA family ATP:ADP antiporter
MLSTGLRPWLNRLAPIYPGEGAPFGLCLVVNLLTVAGIMFGRTSRDSLFFVFFGVEYLPYMYFASAVFLILSSVIYTALVDKVDRGRFLGGLSLVFVAALLVSRLLLPRPAHDWFYPLLYTESQVIWYFSLMQYWTFAGEFFDTRQAKRLFPFLAVGGLLGMLAVGIGSKAVVHSLGTANLLLVWAALILAATAVGSVVFRRYRSLKGPPPLEAAVAHAQQRSEWQKIKNGIDQLRGTPLLRSMAGYILLMWTVYTVVDFCFSKTARAHYPNPRDLATFLGRFVGAQGFLCLLVQLLLTRAVIARLGVGTTINFHPAFLNLGTIWMSLRYGYASVLTTKLGDATMLYTFSDSSYQLLYSPIAPDQRARVRVFIEGYIRPLSLAAAGGLLLLGSNYLKPLHLGGLEIPGSQQLAWGAFALAVIWLGFALTEKRGYVEALLRNLQGDSPALRQAAMHALGKLKDPASLSILMRNLRDDNPVRVVEAVQFLESIDGEDTSQALLDLLAHPDPRVRATAVSALGRRHDAKDVPRLIPLLGDLDRRVRANAVEALGKTEDASIAEKIRQLLYDPAVRVKVNAIAALANLQGAASVAEWVPMLQEMARGNQESRAAAIYVLGRLQLDASVDTLCRILQSPELPLRCEAARALGRLGSARALPCLVESCCGPAPLRHYVRHSLAKIAKKSGPEVAGQLAAMALSADSVMVRSELAHVLGRLPHEGGTKVLDTLLTLLEEPHWRVQWKVLRALERMVRTGSLPETARPTLFRYAREELRGFQLSLGVSQSVVPRPQTQSEKVLAEALEGDRVRIEERVFHVLGILCGRDQMLAIFEKLRSSDARLRADALEALDTLAPREVGQQLLALVEPRPDAGAPGTMAIQSALAGLAHHTKPWMRACVAYYLMDHLQAFPADRQNLLGALAGDTERVVQETALYAGWRAFGSDWEPFASAAAGSPDSVLRRFAQTLLATAPSADPKAASTLVSSLSAPLPEGGVSGGGLRRSPSTDRLPTEGGRFFQIPSGNQAKERINIMLLAVEKVLFLKSIPLFEHLDDEDLAAAAEIASEHEYAANEVIYSEEQVAHHLYVMVRGKVEVLYRVGSSQRRVAVLGEKESFGEMSILDDEPRPRSATVRALEATLVLKIDRDSFRELIYEHPQISFAVFKMLSRRLRQKDLETEAAGTLGMGAHYG